MHRLTAHDLTVGKIVNGDDGSGGGADLVLPGESRDKHTYVVGATGSGKSMFLESQIRQDILNWSRTKSSIILLDPHGSLYDGVMNWLARARLNRPIVAIDLRRDDWVVAYNAIRQRPDSSPSVVVDAFVRTMAHAWGAAGTDQTPLLARWVTNIIEVLYEKGLTLPQAIHLISDSEIRNALTCRLRNRWIEHDWEMAQALSSKDFEQQISSTVNRLRRFVGADQLQLMMGQPNVSLDLRRALDEGWIVLISLATEGGKVSRQNADLFGSMFLTDLWTSAQERGKRRGLRPSRIYVDEFQSFISPTIAENLDQSRGFALSWTMAHQFPLQLLDRGEYGKQLWHSVMENAGNKVVFRMSDEENLRPLAQWLYSGVMNPDEIKHVLYSTKVMGYRQETRESYTTGKTRGTSHSSASATNWTKGTASGTSDGSGDGESSLEPEGFFDEPRRTLNRSNTRSGSESRSNSRGGAASKGNDWSQSESDTVTRSTVDVPVMGRELSQVQFRSLEEQLFRATESLFSQAPRRAVVRFLEMKAPVAIQTLEIPMQTIRRERIHAYADELYAKWDFCLPKKQALDALAEHDRKFVEQLAINGITLVEPTSSAIKLPRLEVTMTTKRTHRPKRAM